MLEPVGLAGRVGDDHDLGLLGFIGARDHMVTASGLRKLIESHIEPERLEACRSRCMSSLSTSSAARSFASRAGRSSTPSYAVALHAIRLLTQRRLVDDITRHQGDARLIVLPPPCPLSVQPIDFAHADELVDRALADARRFLNTGIAKAAA